jgi:flagellar export protein FliJ
MTAFRFRLQKVLDWRHTQLELEEARYRQAIAAVAEIDRARAALAAEGIHTEAEVRSWNPVTECDLAALGEFRLHVRARDADLASRRAAGVKELEARQAAMLEARRRYRLLERLKERGLAAWTAERDKELEQLASEAFLARWTGRL